MTEQDITLILYSTDCPRCKILESKLVACGLPIQEKVTNIDRIKEEQPYTSAPVLSINGTFYEYGKAVQWVNEYAKTHSV